LRGRCPTRIWSSPRRASSRACPTGSRRCARDLARAASTAASAPASGASARSNAWPRSTGDLDGRARARPLDDRTWTEILLPGSASACTAGEAEPDACLRAAVGLEQRCNAELGVRLAARRTLATPAQVAYLTVEERIRAVLDGSSEWTELASIRQERVEQFTKFDVPRVFWGRPRPDLEKA
jgi:hypothetical protein